MSKTEPIDNTWDIIDTRDIIERINWLEGTIEEDEIEELKLLKELEEEGIPDWEYGATLIRESYWETYVEELANDIGAVDSINENHWLVIDWEATAENVRMDYSTVSFDGVDYYYRL